MGVRISAYITGVARLWDSNMADKAAAIEQAISLGGVVVHPPKVTGFESRPEQPPIEPCEFGMQGEVPDAPEPSG